MCCLIFTYSKKTGPRNLTFYWWGLWYGTVGFRPQISMDDTVYCAIEGALTSLGICGEQTLADF
jgi:hypothetical protein